MLKKRKNISKPKRESMLAIVHFGICTAALAATIVLLGCADKSVDHSVDFIPVQNAYLDKTQISLQIGSTVQLVAAIEPANATNHNVTWSSSDSSVATVSSTGLVTGISEGTATISVITEDGGHAASCEVRISPINVTGISLDRSTDTVFIDSAIQLEATVEPANATNQNVTWSSSDSSVATVSSTGLVTGVSEGIATISVTTEDGGYTASCEMMVRPYFLAIGIPYIAVDSLTVTLNYLVINETASTYTYSINYTLVNNTADQAIDEGSFKMYYSDTTGGVPQYGFFGKLFPGNSRTRSYTFEELKSKPFGVLEYHHDNFFSKRPLDESLKWKVDISR